MEDRDLACSLNAPELTDRRALWRRLDPSLVSRRRTDEALLLRFRADPLVRAELPALARAEHACCGFADWSVAEHEDELVLTVTAAPDGLAALAAEFGIGTDADGEREEIARAVYAALQSGNGQTLRGLLHDELRADITRGLPYGLGGTYEGPDRMLRDCWGGVAKHFDMAPLPVEYVPTTDGRLLVLGSYQGHARATGKPLEAAFTHLLGFRDGSVVSWSQLTDSAAWHEATQP